MRAACVRVSRRPHGAGEGVRTWAGNWRWTFSPCAEIGRTGETTGRASSGQGARDRLTVAESVDAALMTLGAAGGSVRLSAIPSEDGTLFSISGILHRREEANFVRVSCTSYGRSLPYKEDLPDPGLGTVGTVNTVDQHGKARPRNHGRNRPTTWGASIFQ